jgi:two-component sensor histidine kinase
MGAFVGYKAKVRSFSTKTGKPVRMTGIDLDITERKLAQIQVQESLQEKEVLLREIHHRVKNNLQVISSLLDLQSQYIEEQTTQEMFRDSQNRVKSMAFVHEQLYQSKNFISIKSADYIKTLTEHLFQSYVMNIGQIDLELDIENFALNINTAIPCSLIINELVSNALKYAFPNTTKGTIKVNLHSVNEKEFILIVKDNGVGFPCNWSFNKLKTLGLQLVNV